MVTDGKPTACFLEGEAAGVILARVLGNVVATQKNERYAGARVMLCQPVTPSGEEFGTVRLQEVISQNLDRSAAGLRDKIEAALSAFAQGTPAVDDITLVIVKRARGEGSRQ